MNNTIDDAISVLAIAIGVIGIGLWLAWTKRNKRWGYSVAPIIWLVHAETYFVTRLAGPAWANDSTMVAWGTTIILHAVISVSFGGAAMLQAIKLRNERNRKLADILKGFDNLDKD